MALFLFAVFIHVHHTASACPKQDLDHIGLGLYRYTVSASTQFVVWVKRKNWWKWGKTHLTLCKDRTRSRRYYRISWILCDVLSCWSTLVHVNCSHGCLVRWCVPCVLEEPDGSCFKWNVITLRKGKWVERAKRSFFCPFLHLRVGELDTLLQRALATQLLPKTVWNMMPIKWFSGYIPF